MNLRADARHVQNNILITRDGQACLADFGFPEKCEGLGMHRCKLENLRYMAPERLPEDFPTSYPGMKRPSKEGDIYSIAMTSFKVCSPTVNHPYLIPLPWARSSQGFYHTMAVIRPMWSPISYSGSDRPVQQTQVRTDGYRTPFGIRLWRVGAVNQKNDPNSLLLTACF